MGNKMEINGNKKGNKWDKLKIAAYGKTRRAAPASFIVPNDLQHPLMK
jgi:hypothetical protein